MVLLEALAEVDSSGLGALFSSISPFLQKLSLLVGGIFGLYFILIVVRIHYERKKVKILKDIDYHLVELSRAQGIEVGERNGSFMHKVGSLTRRVLGKKELEKELKESKESKENSKRK